MVKVAVPQNVFSTFTSKEDIVNQMIHNVLHVIEYCMRSSQDRSSSYNDKNRSKKELEGASKFGSTFDTKEITFETREV